MKKKISIIIFLLLILISTSVFASTPVKMEIVENNICNIELHENAKFEKKIISSDLEKNQVTLQLQISNTAVDEIPEGELILVIDNSSSMNDEVSETSTRKDLVLNSANKLVENLLTLNSSTLKIGVVTFSSSNIASEMGTDKDAQIVSDFSNDLNTLKSKISSIQESGNFTDLDAGLRLAQQSFTTAKNNKYLIVLTDGIPNMNIGNSDLITIKALEEVISTTKSTLTSLEGIKVISLLTGITTEEAAFRIEGENSYTYGQVINGIFGTEENPTIGKFYKINDEEIEKTITEEIYSELIPISKTLKDIVITDYFPQYIVDNFDMAYTKNTNGLNISSEINKDTNSITWTIPELETGKTLNVQYTLTLKDNFNEKIIGEILNTNKNVDIVYKDFNGTEQSQKSDVTPKIKLSNIKVEEPIDDTKAPEELPKTGTTTFILFVLMSSIITIIFAIRLKKFDY